MEKQLLNSIGQANETLVLIINSNDLDQKHQLISKLQPMVQKIDLMFQKFPESYKKRLFQHQINNIKADLKRQQERTQRDYLMSKRITQIAFSSAKNSNPQELPKLVYNPRETAAHNLLQSIVWVDIRESNLMLKKQDIQAVAKQMENNLQIQQEINKLIDEQEKDIDIITSQIKKANHNVTKAEKEMIIANHYQKGDKLQFDSEGNIISVNGQPVPNLIPQEKKLNLNISQYSTASYVKLLIRSRMCSLGFSIKSFFSNLFGYGHK